MTWPPRTWQYQALISFSRLVWNTTCASLVGGIARNLLSLEDVRFYARRAAHGDGLWHTHAHVAEPAPRRLARHPRHASHVAADRREDAHGARAEAESLVARPAVPHRARADDDAGPVRGAHLRGGVRLHRPSPRRGHERRRHAHAPPATTVRRHVLSRLHGAARGA